MIEADIKRIDESITSGTDVQRWELFREIDGKYQSYIADFYKGMWQSSHSSEVLYFNKLKNTLVSVEALRAKQKATECQ